MNPNNEEIDEDEYGRFEALKLAVASFPASAEAGTNGTIVFSDLIINRADKFYNYIMNGVEQKEN